jgi:hypothetical protein
VFSEKERRDFKRLGFLTIRDGVDADLIEEAREMIEDDALPETQAELEAVTEAHEAGESVALDVEGRGVKLKPDSRSILADAPTEEPFRTINEQVYEYAEALVGEGQLEPPDAHARIPLRFPYDGDDVRRRGNPLDRRLDQRVEVFLAVADVVQILCADLQR